MVFILTSACHCEQLVGGWSLQYGVVNILFYFIPSSEFNTYPKQIKVIFSAVKRYRIFSLVTNTIYIFSLQQTEAVSTILGLISFRKDFKCSVLV